MMQVHGEVYGVTAMVCLHAVMYENQFDLSKEHVRDASVSYMQLPAIL